MPFPHEEIDNIARNLKKIGVGIVLLTGGEPFLRDDIVDIVRVFSKYGLSVRLQTAGLLSRFDRMVDCSKIGANDINVSLDTLDSQLGDYINGVDGSWKKAIQTIASISREFDPKFTVCALGCVLSPLNLDHVEEVLDFANAIGWSVSLVPAHINQGEKEYYFRGSDPQFIFNEEEIMRVEALIERLKARKRKGENLFDSEMYLDSIVEFIKTGQPSWRHQGVCDSPNMYFAILPDGRFAPCCDHNMPEDIWVFDKDFPDRYKSLAFHEEVKKIVKECKGCNFGSYPELTLTMRNLPVFWERVVLQLRAGKLRHKAYSDAELLALAGKIRKQ